MTLPTVLTAPPVKAQEAARCWSSAFESWHQAVSADINVQSNISDAVLHQWFESGDGLVQPRGSATRMGEQVIMGVGMMKVRRRAGHRISPHYVARILASEGHIYCAYFWGRSGHACVIHGATAEGFLVMDPAPTRGLVIYPRDHFIGMRRVWMGTSQISYLSRVLEDATADLRHQALSGPTAGEIMSQFN